MFGGPKGWANRNVKPRACKNCGEEFQPYAGGDKWCTSCKPEMDRLRKAKHTRLWRERHPDRNALTKMTFDLKQYGLTPDDYFKMFDAQDGKCAICDEVPAAGRVKYRKLHVDHCHATGKVRGLLCHHCNTALGSFLDSPLTLKSAIEYLEKANAI